MRISFLAFLSFLGCLPLSIHFFIPPFVLLRWGRGGHTIAFLGANLAGRLNSYSESRERESTDGDELGGILTDRVSVFFDTEDFVGFLEALAREPRRGGRAPAVYDSSFFGVRYRAELVNLKVPDHSSLLSFPSEFGRNSFDLLS